MHAALVHLTIDPKQAPAAAAAFTSTLLPAVRSSAGFVSGYWIDPVEGEGFGFLLFETEALARAAVPPSTPWPAPGVTIGRVEVRRVAVSIP